MWPAAIAWSVTGDNLLDQPETLLPAEPEVLVALGRTGRPGVASVVMQPTSPPAWAAPADAARTEGRTLESYASAREATGTAAGTHAVITAWPTEAFAIRGED